jgi:hypothetical protein
VGQLRKVEWRAGKPRLFPELNGAGETHTDLCWRIGGAARFELCDTCLHHLPASRSNKKTTGSEYIAN